MRYTAPEAECLVFTYKEGLLSKIAHDLQIRVTDLWVEVEEGSLEAEFDPGSLKVLTAVKDGVPFDGLSPKDKAKIEGNIRNDVLGVSKHPKIRFEASEITQEQVKGSLTLHGTTRQVEAKIRIEGERRVVEVTLQQPDFGIKPYTAMLGSLRIKPQVLIRISIPA